MGAQWKGCACSFPYRFAFINGRGDLMRSLGSCKWGEKGRSRKDLVAYLFPLFATRTSSWIGVRKWFCIGLKSWPRSHCVLSTGSAMRHFVIAWWHPLTLLVLPKVWSLGYGCHEACGFIVLFVSSSFQLVLQVIFGSCLWVFLRYIEGYATRFHIFHMPVQSRNLFWAHGRFCEETCNKDVIA